MSQENVDVVRRIWDIYMDAFERGDPRAATDVYHQGLVAPEATFTPVPEIPGARTYVGREGFVEFFRTWSDEWAELAMRLEKVVDAGADRVGAIVHQSAIGKVSGAAVEVRFGIIYTLEHGQVIDRRDCQVADALEAGRVRDQR
jgi:ketosteroid isomerase-like protein